MRFTFHERTGLGPTAHDRVWSAVIWGLVLVAALGFLSEQLDCNRDDVYSWGLAK